MNQLANRTAVRWALARKSGKHWHVEWGNAHMLKKIAIAAAQGRLRRELRGSCTPEQINDIVENFNAKLKAGHIRVVRIYMEVLQ